MFPFGGEQREVQFSAYATLQSFSFDDLAECVSENTDVAEVSFNGGQAPSFSCTVKPVGTGETHIYIVSKDQKVKSQKIKVVVEPQKQESTVTAESKSGGSGYAAEQPAQNQQNNYQNQAPRQNGRTVYITPTGKKYHYSSSCAGKNAIETTEQEASRNYGPCKKCVR